MKDFRYIAVEGLINTKKTDFSIKLSERLGANLILDDIDNNPFLPKFYSDLKRYALHTQMLFLLNRHNQQQDFVQYDLFNKYIVSDYFFLKDKIFAELLLDNFEFNVYKQMFNILSKDIVMPDIIVYLQENIDIIHSRIKKTGRKFEKTLTKNFLQDLSLKYNDMLFSLENTRVLIVNVDNNDIISNEHNFELVFDQIMNSNEMIQYFSLNTNRLF